jgi:hypothetical protein
MIDVYHQDSGSSSRLLRSDAIYEVEYALIQIYDDDFIRSLKSPQLSTSLSALFHIAAHIYTLMVLRQILRRFDVVQTFAKPLETALAHLHATESPGEASVLMVWIETLHCLSTLSVSAKSRGARALYLICEALNINGLRDFQRALQGICWIDGVLGDDVVELWNMRGKNGYSDLTETV